MDLGERAFYAAYTPAFSYVYHFHISINSAWIFIAICIVVYCMSLLNFCKLIV